MTDRLIRIPTQLNMGRAFVHHDDRSKNFRAVHGLMPQTPRDRIWRRGQAYDQGYTFQCVAYTGKGILNSLPASSSVDYDTRRGYSTDEFYDGARENDEWPGSDYDGTSGLGLCRWLKANGYINEYRWCFGLNDVLLALSHVGPVGLGVWWYTSMFYPEKGGWLKVSGQQEGGHEVELIGLDLSERCVIGMNSWSAQWGDRGRFKLRFEDLDHLLNQQGDAFVITG